MLLIMRYYDLVVNESCLIYLTASNSLNCFFLWQVISAKKVLEKWKEDTQKYRQKHVELAFFSNVKVMRILRIIQKEQPAEDLVKEIDFLFACDSKITKRLTVIVKVSVMQCTCIVIMWPFSYRNIYNHWPVQFPVLSFLWRL